MNFFQKTVARWLEPTAEAVVQSIHIQSIALGRIVRVDVYLPAGYESDARKKYPLLLCNDGQDLPRMGFAETLEKQIGTKQIQPLIAVGIYCSERRMREYGTALQPDYKGRGDLAAQHSKFVLEELLPHLRSQYAGSHQAEETAFVGFSLGGLSAFDIAWAHPAVFGLAGVFSGALWWRSHEAIPQDPDADRIMHGIVEKSPLLDPEQRFWFQCGALDETADRNYNGVIDAIDDTLDLIGLLRQKGVSEQHIRYLEMPEGQHNPQTWGVAMPDFLAWGFGGRQIAN